MHLSVDTLNAVVCRIATRTRATQVCAAHISAELHSSMFLSIILSLLAAGIATLSFPLEVSYDRSSQHLHKRPEYPHIDVMSGIFSVSVSFTLGSDLNSRHTSAILSTYYADLLHQCTSNPKCSDDIQMIDRGQGVDCSLAIPTSLTSVSSSGLPDINIIGASNTNTTVGFFEGDINLANDIIDNFTFGAIKDGVSSPYFGVGYPFQSYLGSYDVDSGVTTLPDGYMTPLEAMKSQDLILSQSFSVWLSSIASGSPGGLSFGGLDQLRFDDNLARIPIDQQWIDLDGELFTLKGDTLPVVVNSVSISDTTRDDTTIMSGVTQYALSFGLDYKCLLYLPLWSV